MFTPRQKERAMPWGVSEGREWAAGRVHAKKHVPIGAAKCGEEYASPKVRVWALDVWGL